MGTQAHAKNRTAACKKRYFKICYRLFKIIYSGRAPFGRGAQPEKASPQGDQMHNTVRTVAGQPGARPEIPAEHEKAAKMAEKARFLIEKSPFL